MGRPRFILLSSEGESTHQGQRASDDRMGLLKQPTGLSKEADSGHNQLHVLDPISLAQNNSSLLGGQGGKTKMRVPVVWGVSCPPVIRWSNFPKLYWGRNCSLTNCLEQKARNQGTRGQAGLSWRRQRLFRLLEMGRELERDKGSGGDSSQVLGTARPQCGFFL